MNRAKRLYALLLTLYPTNFRNAFEEQMMQTFLDSYLDLKSSSLPAHVHFWLLMLTDECNNITAQHLLALQKDRTKRGMWVVQGLLLIPLFAICYATLVSALLVLPHPAVSGIGFLFVLGMLVLLSAVSGIIISSLLVRLGIGVLARRGRSLS